ncbi:barrier-to-autointegration factor 1-like isoform X1 [Mytilus edulis]|uniref:barrier-to-autointegration factor 1-like isoform X1 n=1 Tax=Mytilus edulis TaxID=6550 RepID=UPI0039EFF094
MQARKILSSIARGIHRSPRVLFEYQKRRIADSKRSNSHKLQHFVSSPMDMQSVTNVPGIGPTYAGRLAHNGITHPSQMYVIYVQCQRNQAQFVNRLNQLTGGHQNHMIFTYNGLNEWHKQRVF